MQPPRIRCLLTLGLALLELAAAACTSHRPPATPLLQGVPTSSSSSSLSRTITFNNNCNQTLWIASTGNAVPLPTCTSNTGCLGTSTCSCVSPGTSTCPQGQSGQCQCSTDADCGTGLTCNLWATPGTCFYAPASGGEFQLSAGKSYTVTIPLVTWTAGGQTSPASWPGRFWARTGCSFTQATCSTSADCTGTACTGTTCECVGGSCLPTCSTNADCTSVSANAQCAPTPAGNVCLPNPACETGDCKGLLNCESGLGGQPPVALAELNLALPPTSDFYDVSNVNGYTVVAGENIGVSITPQSGTFQQPVEAAPAGKTSCSSDSDCTWFGQCDPTTSLCVNAHQCGSAGCVAGGCGVPCTGCGTILKASSWNLDSGCGGYPELAVVSPLSCSATQPCPGSATCSGGLCPCTANSDCGTGGSACGVTEYSGVQACGTFIGCASADQACSFGGSAPPSALNCSTNLNLYGCTGTSNSQSCYTDQANTGCCGCPSWTPASINPDPNSNGVLCQSHNTSWESPAQPEGYAAVFNTVVPTGYSFPFDDVINTMTCTGSTSNNVVYTVTFCPQESP